MEVLRGLEKEAKSKTLLANKTTRFTSLLQGSASLLISRVLSTVEWETRRELLASCMPLWRGLPAFCTESEKLAGVLFDHLNDCFDAGRFGQAGEIANDPFVLFDLVLAHCRSEENDRDMA